ncbi:hypothetical protein ACIRRA_02905 [Nocardia sp. NPDC101769]|uniref:hypothetical protein n=1 Tax=Nocardia sp. NPDC101769 TaxID=3364333 RepID=UPI0037F12C63
MRNDSGDGTHGFTETTSTAVDLIPDQAWPEPYDADAKVRAGAWAAELTTGPTPL